MASPKLPPLPRTVILDYYDSYTNNLLILFTQLYSDAEVLSKVVVIQHDKYTWQEFQRAVLPHVDCVILSPGPGRPDNPEDIGFALDLIRLHPVPILGVCLGHQAIAVAFGGKIINTPRIAHGHVVSVTPDPSAALFAWASAPFDAVVYNSLTVDERALPPELAVTAAAENGGRVVMGLAHRALPIWGVQYHPESISSTHGADTILAFLGQVAMHRGDEGSDSALPRHVQNACAFRVPSPTPATPAATSAASTSTAPGTGRPGGRLELVERTFGAAGQSLPTQDLYERVVRGGALGSVWLDGQTPTTASLGAPAFVLTYSLATRTVTLHTPDSRHAISLPPTQTFFDWFNEGMQELSALAAAAAAPTQAGSPTAPAKQAFSGGFVGYFTYEMKAESLAGYTGADDTVRTDAVWAWVDRFVSRAEDGPWAARGVLGAPIVYTSAMARWLAAHVPLGTTRAAFDAFAADVERALQRPATAAQGDAVRPADAFPVFRPVVPAETHRQRIDACRESIRQGESYELNQTTAFVAALGTGRASDASAAPGSGGHADEAYALYLRLRTFNPAYYSAFLSFPSLEPSPPHPSASQTAAGPSATRPSATGPPATRPRGIHILSSSPERFLSVAGGRIEMRPIKGTRRRVRPGECVCVPDGAGAGATGCGRRAPGGEACRAEAAREDARRGAELVADVKERAENLMIVDLIRADLLACCVPSSVVVPQLIALESYGVHNLVTTVRGALRPGVGAVDAARRCFPPGSMTGAPKLRSVRLLEQTEEHRPRGVYSGALGYFSLDGAADLSVVIRTIVADGEQLSIGAGGAITWLSDRQGEWDEVLTKVQSVVGKLEAVE